MAISRPGGGDRRTSNICGVKESLKNHAYLLFAECISISNSNNQTFIHRSTDSLFLFWGHKNIHNFRMTQGILLPIFTAYCLNKGRHGSSGKSQVLNKAEAFLVYFHLCIFIIDRRTKKHLFSQNAKQIWWQLIAGIQLPSELSEEVIFCFISLIFLI